MRTVLLGEKISSRRAARQTRGRVALIVIEMCFVGIGCSVEPAASSRMLFFKMSASAVVTFVHLGAQGMSWHIFF